MQLEQAYFDHMMELDLDTLIPEARGLGEAAMSAVLDAPLAGTHLGRMIARAMRRQDNETARKFHN